MDKQYLREKLDAMRQNFIESTHHERAVGVLDQAHMSKKSKSRRRFLNPVVKKIKEDVRGITNLPHPIFTGFDCLKYHQ